MVKALIMAGGIGERLWPLSTKKMPKQFHAFGDSMPLIVQTMNRLRGLADRVYIITTFEQRDIFNQLIKEIELESLLVEPFGRNTAPAIALASMYFDPKDVMVVLPSDHIIRDLESFQKIIWDAIREAQTHDVLVTIGITPTSPHTGYGYIERGKAFTVKRNSFCVKKFHEKPAFELAQKYLRSGNYYWNSGMFIWRTEVFQKALEKFLPDVYNGLKRAFDGENSIEEVYKGFQSISIDYGIMEKANNALVIPSNFYWNDVGSWDSVYELEEKDTNGNVIKGKFVLHDVKNSLLFNMTERSVRISSVEDIIFVVTSEGTLLCHRGESQKVRELLK
ncbi:mannose-1-phosphate guanyltransferase [Kosmotoga arenicorallina S304]|uniref:Mannose-1-phosphate guanyltransferase n=1 Tax=Kosmotoga arenicorallina S304 TaxID=1453497 RepID=A0A176K151_9BACT|nr:mannose-1-phosphate guanylyltransferase [Kosmotoga arenicorallina]OAA30400.1 mannose-1-phosphate guanyltransferase [Kosmotoga arenicorallina S304]